eukprot:3915037-Prymnesium_polylepis.1
MPRPRLAASRPPGEIKRKDILEAAATRTQKPTLKSQATYRTPSVTPSERLCERRSWQICGSERDLPSP